MDERYRRQGIGSQLFALAKVFCQRHQYKTLYLHTHHFLPGGYYFWLRNNFNVIMDMQDEWQLVHMESTQKKSQALICGIFDGNQYVSYTEVSACV